MNNEYFDKLLENLELEKSAEEEADFKDKLMTPVSKRINSGDVWYPVKIIDTKQGGRLITVLNNNYKNNIEYNFKINYAVRIINYNLSISNFTFIKGRIVSLRGNEMRVEIDQIDMNSNTSFPSWLTIENRQIAVSRIPGMPFYKDIKSSINKMKTGKGKRTVRFNHILIDRQFASFAKLPEKIEQRIEKMKVDDSQKEAIKKIFSTKDIVLVQGPPGTGKTFTLVNCIKLMIELGEKPILVTAPSNLAVDHLIGKLSEQKVKGEELKIVRIGTNSGISTNVKQHSFDVRKKNHVSYPFYERLEEGEHGNRSKKSKSQHDIEHVNLEKAFKQDRKQIEADIEKEIMSNADIIATTLGYSDSRIKNIDFAYTIIDEASQGIETRTWPHFLNTEKMVLVGDQHQLGPLVKSEKAKENGLSISLFERIFNSQNGVMLQIQYRMHNKIMGFSKEMFYGEGLSASDEVAGATLFGIEDNSKFNEVLEFYDTADCGFTEDFLDQENFSYSNQKEADFIIRHLKKMVNYIIENKSASFLSALSIGIIAPYSGQIRYLKQKIEEEEALMKIENAISVNTVDGFQGQEKDIIYMSLVRSNDQGDIGFLRDEKRMNVAITRAKKKLVIIGDGNTLKDDSNSMFERFMEYCNDNNSFFPLKELDYTEMTFLC